MSKKKNDEPDLNLNDLERLDPNYLEKEIDRKIEASEIVQSFYSKGLGGIFKYFKLTGNAPDWIKTLYRNRAGGLVLDEKKIIEESRLRKGPKASGEKTTAIKDRDHKLIQNHANTLWAKDKSILVKDMAVICEQYTIAEKKTSRTYTWRTIYNRIIQKPKK
jgi:hypothetical protein